MASSSFPLQLYNITQNTESFSKVLMLKSAAALSLWQVLYVFQLLFVST